MNRMIVVSFDAVGAKDLEFLKQQKNFGAFLREASFCDRVMSVYPSVTYPAHTSIMTGRWPKNHGVINNTLVQPWRRMADWMWQRKYIRGTILPEEVMKKGGRVATIFWPVLAGAKTTWNIPEIIANRPWENQITVSLANGSPLFQLQMVLKYGKTIRGITQPGLDHFSFNAALDVLEKKRPDLLMLHLTDADTIRHENGVTGEAAKAALLRHEERLGRLIGKLKEMGIWEETTLVLLGDHYQKDVHTVDHPNYYLAKAGLQTVEKGRIRDWKAICNEADGSAYIYVKDNDEKVTSQVKELFEGLLNEGKCGIERIYSAKEAEMFGADPACALMLEAKDGHYFQNEPVVPCQTIEEANSLDETGHRRSNGMYGTHGYHPAKEGYQTFFAIMGPGIKKQVRIPEMSLVDEGPTLARIMGVDLGKVDGRCLTELFEE